MKIIYSLLAIASLSLPFVITEIGFPTFIVDRMEPQAFFAFIILTSISLFFIFAYLAFKSFNKKN